MSLSDLKSDSILLKPIFSLDSVENKNTLKCSCIIVTKNTINQKNIKQIPLITKNEKIKWRWLFNFEGKNVFMCKVDIEMKYFDYEWEYSILDFKETIFIQKANEFKAKVYSCNGSEDEDHVSDLDKHKSFQQISNKMSSMKGHTFLISLGDTFYYDGIWDHIPELKKVNQYSVDEKAKYQPSQTLRNEIMRYMFNQSLSEMYRMQSVMSKSISIMVWDDHDFGINGYHSHPYNLRRCPLYQMIGYCAAFHYFLFQLKLNPLDHLIEITINDFNSKSFGSDFFHTVKYDWNRIYHFEDVLLLMLDLRVDRTRYSVMKSDALFELDEKINNIMTKEKLNGNIPTYCIIGSSVPVVFFNVSIIEKMFQKVIKTTSLYNKMISLLPVCLKPSSWISNSLKNYLTSLSTDFVDQWSNENHTKEKNQFFTWMYNCSKKWRNMKMIILSGDVHIPYINHLLRVESDTIQCVEQDKIIDKWSAEHVVTSALSNKPIPSLFSEVYNILAKMNNSLI